MATGRLKAMWSMTSSVMSLIANINRDPKIRSKPFSAEEFNPMAPKRKKIKVKVPIDALKMFLPPTK